MDSMVEVEAMSGMKPFWLSLYNLQQQGALCDVQLYVKDAASGDYEVIPVHKVVLVGSSGYFYTNLVEGGELLDIYHFDGISCENLQMVVDYIYRQMTWDSLSENTEALNAAHTLQIQRHDLDEKPSKVKSVRKPKVMLLKMAYTREPDPDKDSVVDSDGEESQSKTPRAIKLGKHQEKMGVKLKPMSVARQSIAVQTELSIVSSQLIPQKYKQIQFPNLSGIVNENQSEHQGMELGSELAALSLPIKTTYIDVAKSDNAGDQVKSLQSREDPNNICSDAPETVSKKCKSERKAGVEPTESAVSKQMRTGETELYIPDSTVTTPVTGSSGIRRSSRTPKPSRLWKEMDKPLSKQDYVKNTSKNIQVENKNNVVPEVLLLVDMENSEKEITQLVIPMHDSENAIEDIVQNENSAKGVGDEESTSHMKGNKELNDEKETGDKRHVVEEMYEVNLSIDVKSEGSKDNVGVDAESDPDDEPADLPVQSSKGIDMSLDHRKVRKRHQCAACKKVLNSFAGLINHERKVHRMDRSYPCPKCDKSFQVNRQLQTHLSKVHGAIKFSCECGAKFKTREGWRYHYNKQHAVSAPLHICDYCGKSFHLKGELKTHMTYRHSDAKPFVCEKCERPFKTNQMLKRHMKTFHSNVRKFMCDVCGTMFKTRNDMKKHREKHIRKDDMQVIQGRSKKFPDGLQYPCTFCGKVFKKRNQQLVHENLQHRQKSEGTSYLCTLCNKTFSIKHYLMQHIKNRHMPKRFQCQQCHLEFCQKSDLVKHVQIAGRCKGPTLPKPYNCAGCHKGFTMKGNLTKHLQKAGRCRGVQSMMSDVIVVLKQQKGDSEQDPASNLQSQAPLIQVAVHHPSSDNLEGRTAEAEQIQLQMVAEEASAREMADVQAIMTMQELQDYAQKSGSKVQEVHMMDTQDINYQEITTQEVHLQTVENGQEVQFQEVSATEVVDLQGVHDGEQVDLQGVHDGEQVDLQGVHNSEIVHLQEMHGGEAVHLQEVNDGEAVHLQEMHGGEAVHLQEVNDGEAVYLQEIPSSQEVQFQQVQTQEIHMQIADNKNEIQVQEITGFQVQQGQADTPEILYTTEDGLVQARNLDDMQTVIEIQQPTGDIIYGFEAHH